MWTGWHSSVWPIRALLGARLVAARVPVAHGGVERLYDVVPASFVFLISFRFGWTGNIASIPWYTPWSLASGVFLGSSVCIVFVSFSVGAPDPRPLCYAPTRQHTAELFRGHVTYL